MEKDKIIKARNKELKKIKNEFKKESVKSDNPDLCYIYNGYLLQRKFYWDEKIRLIKD